jgi:hypothetical protein
MFKLIEILGEVQDKSGQNVVIKYCNYVGGGPNELMSFYYKSMADTIDNGHASPKIEVHNKTRAIYAEINNKIVGICFINWDPLLLSVYIVLTAIDKEYRGKGLYKIIFDYTEQESRKLGAVEITSFVNINNEKNLIARKSVGMMPVVYKTRKSLL